MSLETDPVSSDGPGQQTAPFGSARRRFRLIVWPLAALLTAAASVLWLLAARYQPLSSGAAGGGSFPGLPVGAGIRWMEAGPGEDLYVPPQSGTFALSTFVVNYGSFPVTIEGVTQVPGSPLIPAGPVLYFVPRLQNQLARAPGRVLASVTLRPGQQIEIGMPLRTSRCGYRQQNTSVAWFRVRERFLIFSQTVALPLIANGQVLVNTPGGRPGDPDTLCATRA